MRVALRGFTSDAGVTCLRAQELGGRSTKEELPLLLMDEMRLFQLQWLRADAVSHRFILEIILIMPSSVHGLIITGISFCCACSISMLSMNFCCMRHSCDFRKSGENMMMVFLHHFSISWKKVLYLSTPAHRSRSGRKRRIPNSGRSSFSSSVCTKGKSSAV